MSRHDPREAIDFFVEEVKKITDVTGIWSYIDRLTIHLWVTTDIMPESNEHNIKESYKKIHKAESKLYNNENFFAYDFDFFIIPDPEGVTQQKSTLYRREYKRGRRKK